MPFFAISEVKCQFSKFVDPFPLISPLGQTYNYIIKLNSALEILIITKKKRKEKLELEMVQNIVWGPAPLHL